MLFKDSQALKHVDDWVESLDYANPTLKSWSPQSLADTLRNHDFVFLGAGGQFMTSCVVFQKTDEDLCEILFLCTLPGYEGKGQMTELLKEFVASTGFDRIWLECRADNSRALGMYRRLGFIENGERPDYYQDGTPAILFTFFRNLRE